MSFPSDEPLPTLLTPLTPEDAYKFIRWFNADAIRTIRAALDLGVDMQKLKRRMKKRWTPQESAACADCIDHMIEHPELGVVRWIDGQQYVFVSEIKEPTPTD